MTDKPREPEQTSFDFFDNNYWLIPEAESNFAEETANENRKGYLLTVEEERTLARVWLTTLQAGQRIYTGWPEMTDEEKEEYADLALRKVTRDDALSVISSAIEEAASVDLIKNAAKKYANGDWWTIEVATVIFAEGGKENSYEYVIALSDERAGYKLKTITTEDYPGFEKLSIEEQRKLLGIPSRYRYLRKLYTVIITMAASMLGISLDADRSKYHRVASSPAAEPLRGVSRRKLEALRAEAEKNPAQDGVYSLIPLPYRGNRQRVRLLLNGEDLLAGKSSILGSVDADKFLLIVNWKIVANPMQDAYTITLEELADLYGVSDKNKLWDKTLNAVKALYNIEYEIVGKNGESTKHRRILVYDDPPEGRKGVARKITIHPSEEWREAVVCSRTFEMIPQKIIQLPQNAYTIMRAFGVRKRANLDPEKPEEDNRLRISTLLDKCEYPSPKDLDRASRTKQLIAMPFKRDLDKIVENGFFKSYKVRREGNMLSEAEFTSAKIMNNYNVFSSLVIEVEWNEDETLDYADVREKKAAQIEEGKAADPEKPKRRKTNKPKG